MAERTCSVSWCDRKHHANGLCRTHNWRRSNGIDLDAPFRQYETGERICKKEGCDKPRETSGDFCPMHVMRIARTGEAGEAEALRQPKTRTAGLPRLKRAPNGSPQWNDIAYKREYRLQLDYRLSNDDLGAMLDAQHNQCAICGTRLQGDDADFRERRDFAVDHDAPTGNVRGLLCQSCNKAIGFARHDPCVLRAAITYLESTSGDPCRRDEAATGEDGALWPTDTRSPRAWCSSPPARASSWTRARCGTAPARSCRRRRRCSRRSRRARRARRR